MLRRDDGLVPVDEVAEDRGCRGLPDKKSDDAGVGRPREGRPLDRDGPPEALTPPYIAETRAARDRSCGSGVIMSLRLLLPYVLFRNSAGAFGKGGIS